jgi:hypothetical protein
MKTAVLLLASTVATSALALTDFERFDKQVSKYATQLGGSPKGLCVCRSDGDLAGAVGYLLRGSTEPIGGTPFVASAVHCFIPSFDPSTSVAGSTFICTDFVPLAK